MRTTWLAGFSMASLRPSRSMSHIKSRPQLSLLAPKAKAASVGSAESVPPTSAAPGDSLAPQFDLEKTFPAILAPLSLLRRIPESQDTDALRALAPVFAHCVDAILDSMAHLLEPVPTSATYHHALRGVIFSKDMFLGHVNHMLPHHGTPSRRKSIHTAMDFLDITMSSLKSFLNTAAYEIAQLKPMPQTDSLSRAARESDESTSHFSAESFRPGSNAYTRVSRPTNVLNQLQKPKASASWKPLSLRRLKKRPSYLDLAGLSSAASSTLIGSSSDDLGCGYVHVSINNRTSLAQFPVSINSTMATVAHPEDATELWKDRNGLAQLASLKALVRYMTSPDSDNDVEIVDVFFLCFRFFSSPKETFEALVSRYDEMLPCQTPIITQSHTVQVRIRIARLLYLWVDLHWRAEDSEVLSPMTQFAFSHLAGDIPREASIKLVALLHRRACGGENSRGLRMERTIARAEAKYRQELLSSTWEPREKRSMVRRDFSGVKLEHFHSRGGLAMLALQMTLLLWEKYRVFEPEDAVRHLMTRNGDDNPPASEVARKVADFMTYEKAVHRFVMDSIGSAESMQRRIELSEFFLELATKCHELRNYSASCLIALACDRPSVLPFVTKLRLSPAHERMKGTLKDFYTQENHHMAGYKQALQSCCCPALPGMMLFIKEVARGCGSGPYEQHPSFPGSRLINLKRYRPITWAVRAMEKCHTPFKIQCVDYIRDWLEHILSKYLVGTEAEWEKRIYDNAVSCEGQGLHI